MRQDKKGWRELTALYCNQIFKIPPALPPDCRGSYSEPALADRTRFGSQKQINKFEFPLNFLVLSIHPHRLVEQLSRSIRGSAARQLRAEKFI